MNDDWLEGRHMEMTTLEKCCDILDYMRVPITASDRKHGQYPYYGANGVQIMFLAIFLMMI